MNNIEVGVNDIEKAVSFYWILSALQLLIVFMHSNTVHCKSDELIRNRREERNHLQDAKRVLM